MAKKKKETQEDGLTTLNQLEAYLKESKADHYNYSEAASYKVKTGSLILDVATGGGIGPGLVRATGVSGGGKTSCGLAVARDFQKTVENSMVIHIKAEGRLSDDMIARAGVDTSPEKWFVYKSNIFESVMHLINMLIKSNPENKKYFFGKGYKILADFLFNSKSNINVSDFIIIFDRRFKDKSKMNLTTLINLMKLYFHILKKKIF